MNTLLQIKRVVLVLERRHLLMVHSGQMNILKTLGILLLMEIYQK